MDDGLGGVFTLVNPDLTSPSTYSLLIPSLTCGLFYTVKVTAVNVAGEGPWIQESIWLGEVPSEPLNLSLLAITPGDQLTLGWDAPMSDGCLTILSYTLVKEQEGSAPIEITGISPSYITYVDDISSGEGSVGQVLSYWLKALNKAGESVLSEKIEITVGYVPSAPTTLQISDFVSQTQIQVTWQDGPEIIDNPATLAYRVYLDDRSGNPPSLVYDTA